MLRNEFKYNSIIRSLSCPRCYVCGSGGTVLYEKIEDNLFNAPGQWNVKKCNNRDCGLLWLDPMPLNDDIEKAYVTYYTHRETGQGRDALLPGGLYLKRLFKYLKHGYLASKYAYKNGVGFFQSLLGYGLYLYPALRNALDQGVRYVRYVPQGKLLDVGCGDGTYIKYMQGLGWEVCGVDFDSEAVHNARSKGLSVQLGELAQQQFPSNFFDVITVNHVIEHVPDPLRLLEECRRILKPGGVLEIVTPNAASLGCRLHGASWRGLEAPRHLHIFTPNSLVALLERAGLLLLDLRTQAGAVILFLASLSIRKHGKPVKPCRFPFLIYILAKGMELLERLVIMLRKHAGQELVLFASKEE